MCRLLCRNIPAGSTLIVTSRNRKVAAAAAESLKAEGLPIKYLSHALDVAEADSVEEFRQFVLEEFGCVDCVIHNAAKRFPEDTEEPFELQTTELMRVNFFGSVRIGDALVPLLRPGARMVFVGCSSGTLHLVKEDKRRFLLGKRLSEEEVCGPSRRG